MRVVRCAAVLLAGALGAHAAPKLAIERLALHQYEDGPLLDSSYEFLPGETGWFSCRLAGFQTEPKDADQHVTLSWQVRIVDPAGVLVEKPQAGVIDDTLRSQDKDWVPKFLVNFLLPPFAPGGTYKIVVSVKDELAKAEVSGEMEFHVRGEAAESSEAVVVRDFRFFRQPDDTVPLRDATYPAGATLWARFDMVGYKFAAGNRFSLEYGFALVAADGRELFALPQAATESDESFYPRRRVFGGISLNLDSKTPAGAYTVVITARDIIGNQSAEQRETFRVE
ncbi:MAG: hypothetical protein ACRD5L_15100 [Bryobacteraceae bacterium]